MKNAPLLTALAVLFFTLNVHAQADKLANIDSKGNVLVGGNFKANLSFKNKSSSNAYDIAFSPRLGYYFFNGFAAGFDLNGQYSKEDRQKSNTFGAGPFVRYHILPHFYTELSYNYNTRDLTIYPDVPGKPVSSNIYHNNNYTAGFGYIVLLHRHLTLEPRIDYSVVTAHNAIQSQGPGFSISLHNYFWH